MIKFLALLSLTLTLLSAAPLGAGTSINAFGNYEFETPHGRKMKVPKSTRLVVVAFEKDTGKLVNEYLNTHEPMYMPRKRAIFIADIHKMPSIITNMFALPKLQKYKHLIYLHYDDEFENFLPNEEEKITIVRIKDKKVESVSFISTKEELKAAIEK
jgi:hypothetical protein